MPNRLTTAVSPYLRSHAENPVDWYAWGAEAFNEAVRRDVPLLVSIGYSTCHWCHVMARETFSDPGLAEYLNANFVAIKVDREEHPDVDASYLAAASAFTDQLGWPLNVFVTPAGAPFFAGTYSPPEPLAGQASFRQVLEAINDAWMSHRNEVETTADRIAAALTEIGASTPAGLPGPTEFEAAVKTLAHYEDSQFGGFGAAPKFPVAPVQLFLLERAAAGDATALGLATRSLTLMAASTLRDPVEGGFFRYATLRDWSEPHYERMLYDNALLLQAYTRLEQLSPGACPGAAAGIASFLIGVMQLPSGGFASAQDSESTVDGERVEGVYYALDAARRAAQTPPALDEKVLTGWNGLAIDALALAGYVYDRADWVAAAARAADTLLANHVLSRQGGQTLLRASIGDQASDARATLEDYGMLAGGLLQLAAATGEARYAIAARTLIDSCLVAAAAAASGAVAASAAGATAAAGATYGAAFGAAFAVPGGADPVLVAHGLAINSDPSEGAYPSGLSAMASASYRLYLLTGYDKYREASARAIEKLAGLAVPSPLSFGMALAVGAMLASPITQLVVVSSAETSTTALARHWFRGGSLSIIVTPTQAEAFATAGFELFAGRQREAAYLCHNFVCRLPLTDPAALAEALN